MKMDRINTGRNKLLNQKILLIVTVLILSLAVITLVYASQFVVYSQSDFDAGYSATWNNISRTSNTIGEMPSNQELETKFADVSQTFTNAGQCLKIDSGWLRGDSDTPAPAPSSPLIHHASVQPEKVLPGDLMTVTASQQILLVSGIPSITKNTKFCYECYRRLS